MPKLEVWVKSASGLKGPDLLDVPDPFCKVFMDDVELLKTDHHNNEVNPVWNTKRSVNLTVPKNQLKFEIWDKDRFSSEDFVGDAVLELDDDSGSPMERALHLQRKGKDVGTLFVQVTYSA